MYPVTIRDKILAHLYRYRRYSHPTIEGGPIEITQEGLGNIVGITRSHACVVLNRLIENDEVEIYLSTVKGSKRMVKRKLYHITEHGKSQYLRRLDELREVGIDLENIGKELNECTFDEVSRISRDSYDDIGCLLVLREEVCKDDMDCEIPLITFRTDGRINVKKYTRENIIRKSSQEDRRRWHSKAADWCMDHGRPVEERVYHLVLSGRDWEAAALVRRNRFVLMDSIDAGLTRAVSELCRRQSDTDVIAIGIRMAINNGLLDDAESLCRMLSELNPTLARRMMSEVLAGRNHFDEALDLAKSSCGTEPDSGIT